MLKKFLLVMILLGIGLVFCGKVVFGAEEGLVAHWSFDEGRGTEAKDTGPFGNHGEIKGEAVWVEGVSRYALMFDGAGDFIEIPHSKSLELAEALTVSAWIKIDLEEAAGKLLTILDKTRGTFLHKAWMLSFDDRWQHGFFQNLSWNMVTGTTWKKLGLEEMITGGKWHHIVGTFDMKAPDFQQKLYLDGTLVGAVRNTEKIIGNELPLFIGATRPERELYPGYFKGIIDEVKIYNRALTAEEIAASYQAMRKEIANPQGKQSNPSPGNKAKGGGRSETLIVNEITLIEAGKPKSMIVIDPEAPEVTSFAASELQSYLEKIFAVRLPIMEADEAFKIESETNLILIGESIFTEELGLSPQVLQPDGFQILSRPNTLIILGKDDPRANPNYTLGWGSAGSLYGVYGFLRELGVRWFFPGEIGTVIPTKKDIVVENLNIKDAPFFIYRHGHGPTMTPIDIPWRRKVGFGGTARVGGSYHPWTRWHHRYLFMYPELFALRADGSRGKNLCWYGEGVRERMIAQVKRWFRR